MRLVHSVYGLDFELGENKVNVLVIEAPNIFSLMIDELLGQMQGNPGGFILSAQDTIKVINKEAEMIVNPFVLDCNEKRIQQKLYQELVNEMNESMVEQTMHLQGHVISYLEKLLQKFPYPLEFDVEGNMAGLLKWCHVEIDNQGEILAEKLINYIRALKQLCNIRIIFFVNLKLYLTQMEIEEIYKYAFYEKIHLFLLENSLKERLDNENICILDKDLCIIDIG